MADEAQDDLTPPDEGQDAAGSAPAASDSSHVDQTPVRSEAGEGNEEGEGEPTSSAGKRQATGWFLEQAGGKALKCGGAVIYPKHANIIVKSEGCTSQDVYELSKLMAKLAKEVFHLDLVREVRFVGKFKGMPEDIRDVIW